jgi:2-hydroxy-3-oxopropionate reductase
MELKLGFVGLGIMGRPMCRRLLSAGYRVTAYDRVPNSLEEVVAAGAIAATSGKQVAQQSDVIITMLPDGPDVEQAVLSPDGILAGANRGSVLVDMSSINPLTAQRIGAVCHEAGIELLDAPVSGGEPKAIDGTLAIMVGGRQDVLDRVTPILKQLGSSITLTGPLGAGNTTKLANQIIVACNIAALGEALRLVRSAGLDPEVVLNAIKGGLAGSTVLNAKGPMAIARNFKPGFKTRLTRKTFAMRCKAPNPFR